MRLSFLLGFGVLACCNAGVHPYYCLRLDWTDSSARPHSQIEGVVDVSGFRVDDFLANTAEVAVIVQAHELRALKNGEHQKVAESLAQSNLGGLLHTIIKDTFPVMADGRVAARSVHEMKVLPPASEMVKLADKYGMKLWSLKRPLDANMDRTAPRH